MSLPVPDCAALKLGRRHGHSRAERVTRPIFCTTYWERVYMQPEAVKPVWGEGMECRPPAPGAYNSAPSAVSGCYIPPAMAQSQSGPPSTNRRSHHSGIRLSASHGNAHNTHCPRDYRVRCITFRFRPSPATGASPGPETLGRCRIEYAPGPLATPSRPTPASITSGLPILRSTRMARHSLVYSSSNVRSRSVLPSCVLALTKS